MGQKDATFLLTWNIVSAVGSLAGLRPGGQGWWGEVAARRLPRPACKRFPIGSGEHFYFPVIVK